MGCGGSKLELDNDAVPARFRPILRRRLEEIRARRNLSGISKKELLGEATVCHEYEQEDHQEEVNHNEEAIVSSTLDPSFHITQDCPPTLQKINVDVSIKSCQNDGNIANDYKGEFVQEEKENLLEKCEDNKEVLNERKLSNGLLEEVREDIDADEYDQGELFRGSPSFRVYCVASPDEDVVLDEHLDGESTGEGQRYSISQESSSSNEVSVKQMSKKGKRSRKFKIMMPKGGKNMFINMQSLYHFPCSSQSNNHLLQRAAA